MGQHTDKLKPACNPEELAHPHYPMDFAIVRCGIVSDTSNAASPQTTCQTGGGSKKNSQTGTPRFIRSAHVSERSMETALAGQRNSH